MNPVKKQRMTVAVLVLDGAAVAGTFLTFAVQANMTDRIRDYPVRFSGILPDLFREGQTVIARGEIEGDIFVAQEVLAKHDETYMPPEVAEKIAEAHAKAAAVKQAESGATTDATGTVPQAASDSAGEGP